MYKPTYKNKLIVLLSIVILAVSPFFTGYVIAQPISDPNDVFTVIKPAPNSPIVGNTTTQWNSIDANQATIPYELTLNDAATCATRIATVSTGAANQGVNNVSWSSSGPVQDTAQITDGTYCLQLCVSLSSGDIPYTACNLRQVRIRNHNSSPVIVSTPQITSIYQTQTFTYDVNATDANGDNLKYRFQTAPSFLTINPNSGLITSTSSSKPVGNYSVVVIVEDEFRGSASQSFTLHILAAQTNTSTSSSSSSTSSSTSSTHTSTSSTTSATSSTTSTNGSLTDIQIISPNADSEFVGVNNVIKWTATDEDGIDTVKILYSDRDSGWIEIVELSDDETEFVWDVSELDDGSYRIQVVVIDELGTGTSEVSPEFTINNNAGSPGGITSRPLIINVKPEELDEIIDLRPKISGEFSPPIGQSIDTSTFRFFINDEDKVDICQINQKGFECVVTRDLALGSHKVKVEIDSTDGQTATREWTFSIVSENSGQITDSESGITLLGRTITKQAMVWLVVICLVGLILLLIPWILYTLWRRRDDEDDDSVDAAIASAYPTYEEYYRNVANSTSPPDITANYYPVAPVEYQVPTGVDDVTVNNNYYPVPVDTSSDITTSTSTDGNIEWLRPAEQPAIPNDYSVQSDGIFSTPVTSSVDNSPLPPATNTTTTTTTTSSNGSTESDVTSFGYGQKID